VSGFSRTSALEDLDAGDVIPEREWRERERTNVLRALAKAQFRLYGPGGAADLLGINPATLASRLKKLGIRPRDFKAAGHP
jgi:transcriptional regulator with GAF, ATPase, and Fis domain